MSAAACVSYGDKGGRQRQYMRLLYRRRQTDGGARSGVARLRHAHDLLVLALRLRWEQHNKSIGTLSTCAQSNWHQRNTKFGNLTTRAVRARTGAGASAHHKGEDVSAENDLAGRPDPEQDLRGREEGFD